MHGFCSFRIGPAADKGTSVLDGVNAPRCARPLRASALTPPARGARRAITAGPFENAGVGTAIPLAIRDWMVSSLDVVTTREDRWDRFGIVRGFWGCRGFAS